MQTRIAKYFGAAVGVTLFVVALWVLHRELSGERLHQVMAFVRSYSRPQLALAVLLTVVSFAVLTGYDVLALRYVRRTLPYASTALASFLNYSFAQGLGFPLLTGGSVRFRLYSHWGLSAVQITNLIAFASLTFWLGVLTLASAVFLAFPRDISRALSLPLGAVRPLGAMLLLLVALYLSWTWRGRRIVRIRGFWFRRPPFRLAIGQLVVSSADWLIASSVLFVLLPPVGISFPAFFGIFLIAFVAGIVSHVPGGIGVFESVVIVLLPPEVSEGAVFAALMVYRIIYYLLPLMTAAGALVMYELMLHRAESPAGTVPVRDAVKGAVKDAVKDALGR